MAKKRKKSKRSKKSKKNKKNGLPKIKDFWINLLVVITLAVTTIYGLDIIVKSDRKTASDVVPNYKVMYVSDGDTIIVKKLENGTVTGELIKVRLFGIDAPEKNQDYGYESKQALMNYIKDREVRIEGKEKDRYGRLLGTVYVDDINVNEEMVASGNAWWYEKYNPDNEKLKQYQENAKKKKLGIFAKKGYITPWDFRDSKNKPKK